jgi:hypothetical protein
MEKMQLKKVDKNHNLDMILMEYRNAMSGIEAKASLK